MKQVSWMPVAVLGCSLALGGCVVVPPGYYNPPTSVQSLGTDPFNHAPESANGLPPGAQVVAPLTSVVGQLNAVRVGPPVPPAPYPMYYYRGY